METCEWHEQDDSGEYWGTGCEKEIVFEDYTPQESEYIYCPFCGKKIKFQN